MKKLTVTMETVEEKVPKLDSELEIEETCAENVIEAVQNIFEIASVFDNSVLGLLGMNSNKRNPPRRNFPFDFILPIRL